jgi:hypothetical protein
VDSDPPSSSEDRPLSLAAAAVWTIVALFLDLLFSQMIEAGREGALFDLVSRTACRALAYSVVFFIILRVHEPQTSIRRVLALRAPAPLGIVLALLVGAALALPTDWLDQALEVHFPRPEIDKEALDRLLSVTTMGKRVAMILTLVFVQPAFDELFFRGALFTPLRRTRRAETVIVATAAVETLGSFSPRLMLSLLGVTLVFAWIRGTTGSIFPGVVARMAYSAVSVVPIAIGREAPKPTKLWLLGSAALGILGLIGLQILSRRDSRLHDARLEDGTGS